MNVLDLSAFDHDSTARLCRHGELVAAVEEEKLARVKHDRRVTWTAGRLCLDLSGLVIAGRGHGLDLLEQMHFPQPLGTKWLRAATSSRGQRSDLGIHGRPGRRAPSSIDVKIDVKSAARRLTPITLPLAVACLLARPATARADAGGFTAELAAGLSGAILVGPPREHVSLGVAPMIAGIGWQASARFVLSLRTVTYLVPATVAGRREPFLASSIGPAVSLWLAPRVLVGAALGPCLVWPAPVGASPYLRSNRGAAVLLRAAWAAGRSAGGDLVLGVEVLPTFFAGDDLLVGTLVTAGMVWR